MLPDPENFGIFYYEAYKVLPPNLKKKIEWKKLKKKLTKFQYKSRNKIDLLFDNDTKTPKIELPGNASVFAIFASIRLAVLDRWMLHASQEYLHSSCSAPTLDQSEVESDTEDNSQSCCHIPIRISKVVGLGLRSVFELIKESRITHPALCTKALLALLNILQGQSPEGLKSEPSEVIDSLFDLLLDLATLHGPESSVPNDGTHLTAVACGCLLSLVVVRGETGKYLSATAALLMCPRALSLQNIKMALVLCSLQRSVYGVLLEKNIRPDWILYGVPVNSKIDSFFIKLPNELNGKQLRVKSLACDGQYFYLFTCKGLFKIGCGFGGTAKGHVMVWKSDFYPNDNGVLVHSGGNLYLKLCGRRGGEFLLVDKTNLLITGSVLLHNKDASSSIIFSDGEYLGIISPAKDDGFVVRMLNHNTSPASLISELPLKLAKKCVEVVGAASFEEEIGNYSVNIGSEEVSTITAGKEFGLIKTISGKIFYCGKSSALGIKQAGVRTGKWSELNLAKSPKVNHIAVGHDGLHAILLTEDGSVFFTGTARRGEDGDQSKVRRQPKPVKPRKMIKVDGHHIVSGACNNGTTALININGELIMFGKDTTHADSTTGIVTSLKGEFISQVALGKAHVVALTNKGQVYTFGINNKYQCGRDFNPSKSGSPSHVVAMDTCGVQEEHDFYNESNAQRESANIAAGADENLEETIQNICPPGTHSWHDDMCMICSICRECTGYSISCLSSISSERNPGQVCGCGEGDSGCAICGCCRICAREVVDNSELADLAGMMKLDLIFHDKTSIPQQQRSKLQEQIQSRLEEKKNKSKKSIHGFRKQSVKTKSSKSVSNAVSPTVKTGSTKQTGALGVVKDQSGSDIERDASRISCLPPAKISLPSESPVVQIACGLHHSLLLLQNGQVYTFGSNLYGQLGSGDILPKSSIQLVKLPCSGVHIAAGSNHSVILTSKGEVYTFGNAQRGQLGRLPNGFSPQDIMQPGQSSTSHYNNPRTPWYSFPGPIPNIGSKHGRRATWIGASGDQTFLKLDESLINSVSLVKSTVMANKNCIVLLPKKEEIARSFKCIVINKKDGNCNYFKNQHQVDFTNKIVCMDHIYNVIWAYDTSTNHFTCYNIIATELQINFLKTLDNKLLYDIKPVNEMKSTYKKIQLPSILSPELALPVLMDSYVTRFQAAINLLCCLDILTTAHELQLPSTKENIEDNQFMPCKQYSKEDFQAVNRFESHGGGWGYSGHSIEAIRFMTDTDVLLGGFGLFGGRGEYTAKLKLIDIGPDGGEQEIDGELVAETEEIPYECGPRQKFPILFDEPIHLQAHRWYVAWCRISGPSSDCGSSGQAMVTTEDQVLFYFKSSKKSNNGTDVNAGQIPQLLYKIISPENQTPPKQIDMAEPIHILSKDFSRTVSRECFQSLLSLLQWSWNTFKWGVIEGQVAKSSYNNLELERLVYISRASLRLICTYTNEIYPRHINKQIPTENVDLAECIGDTRALLKQILSDNIPMTVQLQNKKSNKTKSVNIIIMNEILDECHNTFVACFHAFYPTSYLKWNCLCDLLGEINKDCTTQPSSNQRLLSAILCALCAPCVRLRSIFQLVPLNIASHNCFHRCLSPSDNTGLPMMSVSDSHHYPILVEQMTYKSQIESNGTTYNYQWNDVLDCLINLASSPVLRKLKQSSINTSEDLTKYCCNLLAKAIAELVLQCSSAEEDLQSCGRILYLTPPRFTRINQSRTWNTGNGSPDAICFQVDREGISIVGVGVYGGIGHYEYELELLEDTSSLNGDSHMHAHRWNSLEITRGSYGPEDFAPDIIEIKFERGVPIKESDTTSRASTDTLENSSIYSFVPDESFIHQVLATSSPNPTHAEDNAYVAKSVTEVVETDVIDQSVKKIKFSSVFPQGLEAALNKYPDGQLVLLKRNKLTNDLRTKLTKVIVSELFGQYGMNHIKGDVLKRVADEIETCFPAEKGETYYIPYDATIKKGPRGKLYTKLINTKSSLKLANACITTDKIDHDQHEKENVNPSSGQKLQEEYLTFLKIGVEPYTKVLEAWEGSFKLRRKLYLNTELVKIYEDFPCLRLDPGLELENVKYAIRLRNHGGRTNNGDGGVTCVKGPDNTTFIFSTCSLSFNGTTLTRGQIPVLLYYSNPLETGRNSATKSEEQARRAALSMASKIIDSANNLMALAREKTEEVPSASILSSSSFVTSLLPLVLAHLSPLATSDSRSAVHILNLIQEILSHVAALNLIEASSPKNNKDLVNLNSSTVQDILNNTTNTTSKHYISVESEHPYKASTVTNYRVTFPESVKWMSLEFDPACSTIQPEDSVQLYIPAIDYTLYKKYHSLEDIDALPLPYWPVLHKFSGSLQWPTNSVILPGNEVIFSLETASDYLKDERLSAYGFKCLVVGYDWPLEGNLNLNTGLKHLEAELSFLGGMCTASLMKKDLLLPPASDESDVDIEVAEVIASEIFSQHNSLLAKGLALNSPPTVQQALDGTIPYSVHSNERLFLRDFVNCTAGTSGGRLGQWLQPGSRVDPNKCQVLYSREELHCGWPAIITIVTRDQYSDLVYVPNMKVEVKAVPIDKKELGESDVGRKIRRISQPDSLSFGGLPPPPLHYPYEATIRDKMCFHSITVMKPYQNYSFEELRYTSPPVKRSSENMLVRPNSDGTYSATWTPASIGCYSIVVNIDGYDMEEVFKVEVKEPPQGIIPPSQNTAKKSSHQPNKLRKFVAKNSAGLRVRAHPSLQSEQIGVVHVNGTIAFIDEIHNDDGVWLRLSADTIKQYCTVSVIEAWCLQYNQHLGKTLLLPVEEPKSILDQIITDTILRKLPEIEERHKTSHSSINYQVIKCGASGHNIRSRPSLKAPPVGMLVLGNKVGVTEYTINSDGCWVLLDEITKNKYCFNTEGDAWSLAISQNNILYLGNMNELDSFPKLTSELDTSRLQIKSFNFSSNLSQSAENSFSFLGQNITPMVPSINSNKTASTNPFIFGEKTAESPKISRKGKKDIKVKTLPIWFKGDVKSNEAPLNIGENISMKYHSECSVNGNGVTTLDTSIQPQSPKSMSQSSSPVSILCQTRRGSNQSDTSALVSSITRDISQSPSQVSQPKEISPSPSGSSLQMHSGPSSSHTTPKKDCFESEQIEVTQTGTQTSPDNTNSIPVKGHFSIGIAGKEEKVSPKVIRKDRTMGKIRSKRAISPAHLQHLPANSKMIYPGTEPVKQAMSPTVAESLRAVFAAFLWHEGIVHDAMACASFLKFHPTLPKQGAVVVTRHPELPLDKKHKEEKARQRHSVEVTNAGYYLHIQPSTLESLTRSAANASANRSRRKVTDNVIKEDKLGDNYRYNTISVLPPALKSLVYLWEDLTSNCLQAISQQMVLTSPTQGGNDKTNKTGIRTKNETRDKNSATDKESKKSKKKKMSSRNYLEDIGLSSYVHTSGADTLCELCGDNFPHPVTYHMHQAHPGCGQHAGGKGYNSGGNYCLGWAGNCGDGGAPGSSWYLLCDNCREKYVKTNIGGNQINLHNKCAIRRKNYSIKNESSQASPAPLESHIIMKNNAMFLLDLASSTESGIRHPRRSSVTIMPSVSENSSPPESTGPFGPLPPFQCLNALDANLCNGEPQVFSEFLNKRNFQEGVITCPSTSDQRPLSEVALSDNDICSNKGLRFHRSVSMGTNGIPWSKSGYDGRVIMMRKRNNNSCEIVNEGVSSLLCNPSNALQKLTPKKDNLSSVVKYEDNESSENLKLLQRPVLQFILQQHDLDSLQLSMKRALRKAMCRVHAMQALNWLLRSVTQPICLHDLLWWFVTSLTPAEINTESEEDNRPLKKDEEHDINVCEHPLSDITIAGEAVHPLPSTFHSLLQTIADLMVILPMGSALQQIAVRCWGIRFTATDHTFLHRSQVFSNISKILSKSEEIEAFTLSLHESYQKTLNQLIPSVERLKDLTAAAEIKASSRQAMVGSLTDNSTETFWESGDEDRNKTKSITIICSQSHHPFLVCVHIDNCRDLGNKVSSITFYSGQNTDELIKLRSMEVETRLLGGWVNCSITGTHDNVIRLELKGPDNSVRIRQIRVLGKIEGESLQVEKQCSSVTLQQKNCEAETLRVFRLITSQVFGKLLQGDAQNSANGDTKYLQSNENIDSLEESNDLREHMVGILFSRSKLTHLQKQVIVHIVQAIRKETERVHEEWESNLYNSTLSNHEAIKNSDTYCFEMLSMVLALSGSSVGRAYLSHQCGLLGDLITLLHTGSARVQRQVTSLLKRILSEITPETFAKVVGVKKLPIKEFSIITSENKDCNSGNLDINQLGILDVFLSVIAKALPLQVKIRSKNGNTGVPKEINTISLATSINKNNLQERWWLKGSVNKKLAEVIIQLMKDMASGKLSESWAIITKGAIAENILRLTYLSDEQKLPNNCIQTPTLWLALASLCVLDKDHVEKLSSGQWRKSDGQPIPPRPTCGNHDDGETVAIIQCNYCGNLCAECDRYLHLHRKTRNHQRQVCKEEEEAIKVELHEGCGRIKLFWLLALADPRTLKALVEFREGGTGTKGVAITGMCRFCGTIENTGLLAIGNICADHECQEYGKTACTKLLNCGHMCGGLLGETKCLPCLHGCSNDNSLKQDADDMCMICFTEGLSCAPAIQLKCRHVFHSHCCKTVLMKKWAGPRITFSFLLCPICKEEIYHELLEELLTPVRELYNDVRRKAQMRLEYEGLHTADDIVTVGARFFNDPASYAMDRYAYYVCFKCNKAYYGGEARCDVELIENYDPTELVCGACSDVARAQMCPKHGTDFLEYKCRYCCSVAVFFCFGTTHFCNPCHDDFQRVTNLSKSELPICPAGPRAKQLEGDECPLHVEHPPTGEEFALGCGVCRNAHTF